MGRELFGIFLRKGFVDLQRLLIFLPGLFRPVLGAIQNPKIVERRRYVRQIGLRLFLRQRAVDLQRLLIFVPSLIHPVLAAIKQPQVIERYRYERQIGLRLFLRQFAVNPERLLKFLPSLLHPALVAIKNPQVVKRRRYGRQIGLRLFLGQLTVGLQLFFKFLPSRLDPIRRAIENPRIVEPVRGSDIFPRWFSRGLPSESAQIVRGTWICCRRLVNDCDFYNGRTSRLVRDNYIRQARRIDPQTCERQQNYATEAPEHRSDGPRGLSDSSSSFFTRVTVRENCAESCCAKLRPAQA